MIIIITGTGNCSDYYTLAPETFLGQTKTEESLRVLSPNAGIKRLIEIIHDIVSKSPKDRVRIEIYVDGSKHGIGKSTFIKSMVRNFLLPVGWEIENLEDSSHNRKNESNGTEIKVTILVYQGWEFVGSEQYIRQKEDQGSTTTIGVYLSDTNNVSELDNRLVYADVIIHHHEDVRLSPERMKELWALPLLESAEEIGISA